MPTFTVDFGSDYTGYTGIGFTELDSTGNVSVQRVTDGIVSLGRGAYAYTVVPNSSSVVIRWDTGTTPPLYAYEDIGSGGITVNDIMTDPRALTVAKFLGLK